MAGIFEDLAKDLPQNPKSIFGDLVSTLSTAPVTPMFQDLALQLNQDREPTFVQKKNALKIAAEAALDMVGWGKGTQGITNALMPYKEAISDMSLKASEDVVDGTIKGTKIALEYVDAINRHIKGRGIRWAMPERIKKELPPAPTDVQILKAIRPDLELITEAIFGEPDNIPQEFRSPLSKHIPPKEGKEDIYDMTGAAETFLGIGLAMANPADWAIPIVAAKGFTKLASTTAGQYVLRQIVAHLHTGFLKQMQMGRFKPPKEFDDLLFEAETKINRLELKRVKLTKEMLDLTPAERQRIQQLRVGKGAITAAPKAGVLKTPIVPEEIAKTGKAITEMEFGEYQKLAKIRTYKEAYSKFIELLSRRYIQSGIPSEEMATLIKQNLKYYAPRLYRIFEKPISKQNIPSNFLERLWDMDDSMVENIGKLDPKLKDHFVELVNKIRAPMSYDASGFKKLRIKGSERLKTRMEVKLTDVELEKIENMQSRLRESLPSVNINKIKSLNVVSSQQLRKSGVDIEDLAAMFGPNEKAALNAVGEKNVSEFVYSHVDLDTFLKNVGKPPTMVNVNWALKVSEEAKMLIGERNKIKGSIGNLEGLKSSMLEKATQETEIFRYALGEIKDPAVILERAAPAIARATETSILFRKVAENPEWVLPVGKEMQVMAATTQAYEKMPKVSSLGVLSDRMVRSDIANAVNEVHHLATRTPSYLIKAMGFWKFGKVVLNPATHFRNFLSNTILLDLSGVPLNRQPSLWASALNDVLNDTRLFKQAINDGALRDAFIGGEVRQLRKSLLKSTEAKNIIERAADVGSEIFDKAGSIYQQEEQLAKLVKYKWEILHGTSRKEAARLAQEALFDYSKVPPLIRKWRESPVGVPFLTFPYKALPAVYKAIEKNPLSVLKYEMLFSAIDKGSSAIRGLDEEAADAEKKVALRSDRFFSRFVRLPFVDSNNNPYFLDMTYILPWGDVGEIGMFKGVPQAFTPGGLALPILQLGFNKDFRGFPIVRKSMPVEENARNSAMHLLRAYFPALVPGGYAATRMTRAIRGMSDRQTGLPQSVPTAIADALFGLKMRPVDIDAMRISQRSALEAQSGEVDILFARASRNLSKGVIDEIEFERQRLTFVKAYDQIIGKIQELEETFEKVERAQ